MTTSHTQKKRKKTLSREVAAEIPEVKDLKDRTLLRRAINVFLVFHIIAIACWAVPLDIQPLVGVRDLVKPYMLWTGLFQSWNTFAPDPLRVNQYLKAVVISHNHHLKIFAFPRMEELSLTERYSKERYRKFAEVVPDQRFAPIWPDVANHIARSFRSQTDPPEKVILIDFQTPIKPEGDSANTPAPTPATFFEKYIDAEDLQ